MSDYQFTAVEILKGVQEGDPRPCWFVNACINDGTNVVLDVTHTHFEARISACDSAREYDVPVEDLSPEGRAV